MDFWRIVIEAFLFAGGLFAFEKTILLSARAAEKNLLMLPCCISIYSYLYFSLFDQLRL